MSDDAECTCTPLPQPEGLCAWCDVHGQPSAAWEQGLEAGKRHVLELIVHPSREITRQNNEAFMRLQIDHEKAQNYYWQLSSLLRGMARRSSDFRALLLMSGKGRREAESELARVGPVVAAAEALVEWRDDERMRELLDVLAEKVKDAQR